MELFSRVFQAGQGKRKARYERQTRAAGGLGLLARFVLDFARLKNGKKQRLLSRLRPKCPLIPLHQPLIQILPITDYLVLTLCQGGVGIHILQVQ